MEKPEGFEVKIHMQVKPKTVIAVWLNENDQLIVNGPFEDTTLFLQMLEGAVKMVLQERQIKADQKISLASSIVVPKLLTEIPRIG